MSVCGYETTLDTLSKLRVQLNSQTLLTLDYLFQQLPKHAGGDLSLSSFKPEEVKEFLLNSGISLSQFNVEWHYFLAKLRKYEKQQYQELLGSPEFDNLVVDMGKIFAVVLNHVYPCPHFIPTVQKVFDMVESVIQVLEESQAEDKEEDIIERIRVTLEGFFESGFSLAHEIVQNTSDLSGIINGIDWLGNELFPSIHPFRRPWIQIAGDMKTILEDFENNSGREALSEVYSEINGILNAIQEGKHESEWPLTPMISQKLAPVFIEKVIEELTGKSISFDAGGKSVYYDALEF
jgi:hypothetical protein